ncbi:MAG: YwqG family protein [Bacteroidales bacterium]|nr:YwqG family protein [Bacteroidales bacterium]
MSSIGISFRQSSGELQGRSKWWGAPDLPAGSAYPVVPLEGEDDAPATEAGGEECDCEPLTFLCQIRCEDIAALDPEGLLPHEGMLYFFAAIDYFLGLDSPLSPHIGEWDSLSVRVIYSPSCDNLEPYDLHYEDGSDVFFPAVGMDFKPCGSRDDSFKLLGRPYLEEIYEQYPDCISLLQVDGNDDWKLRFFDCGMLCLLIRADDLAARRWDRCFGYMHSF